jgi:hypothetical protein
VNLTVAGAHHLAPPLDAAPCSSKVLRRSPSPYSTSPLKELKPRARSRRQIARFFTGEPSSPPPNLLPLARLRPSQHHWRVPGELPVFLDPSPFLFPAPRCPPWPAVAGIWEPVGLGRCPTDLASPRVSGPSGQSPRVKLTSVQKVLRLVFNSRKIDARV